MYEIHLFLIPCIVHVVLCYELSYCNFFWWWGMRFDWFICYSIYIQAVPVSARICSRAPHHGYENCG